MPVSYSGEWKRWQQQSASGHLVKLLVIYNQVMAVVVLQQHSVTKFQAGHVVSWPSLVASVGFSSIGTQE